MKTAEIHSIHLIGVGGAAMAPLAGMLAERGYQVTGSDAAVYPPASTLLTKLGIQWKEGFSEANLKPAPDLVIVGNAISRGNPEVEYVLDYKLPYVSMPEAIKDLFLPGHDSVVVTGTHGKTTTTSMLAWIFQVAGRNPDFLIGGIAENFGKSYGLGGGREFILEGDEYDSAFFDKSPKFLKYRPDELIVTSLEFDHADIYVDLAAIELQFRRLVNIVPRHGRIVCWAGSATVLSVVAGAHCPVETYGLAGSEDWVAADLEVSGGISTFRVLYRSTERARIRLPLTGRHNVLNSLAAAAIALGREVSRESVEQALSTFRGVARRMQVRGEFGGVTVVDDFAHHPTAIRATIEGARSRWPGRRLWVAFDPRSNTMRRNIMETELSGALATADGVVLGPVNRSELLSPAERLSPQRVIETVRASGLPAESLTSSAEIVNFLGGELRHSDVVLVLSNGSFDGLCDKLTARLAEVAPAARAIP